MNAPPKSLADFQAKYATYLRDPNHNKRPTGIPRRQSGVYEALLFNNLCGFIQQCFPVCKSVLSSQKWQRICRTFFRDWSCSTPYFGKIPYEFVQYLQSEMPPAFVPTWFSELAEYEWLELYVLTHPEIPPTSAAEFTDISVLHTNPTLQIQYYNWAVHTISANNKPTKKAATHILIYRDNTFASAFIEVNLVTAALLECIEKNPANIAVTCQQLARLLNRTDAVQLKEFAAPIIQELIKRQVLWLQ